MQEQINRLGQQLQTMQVEFIALKEKIQNLFQNFLKEQKYLDIYRQSKALTLENVPDEVWLKDFFQQHAMLSSRNAWFYFLDLKMHQGFTGDFNLNQCLPFQLQDNNLWAVKWFAFRASKPTTITYTASGGRGVNTPPRLLNWIGSGLHLPACDSGSLPDFFHVARKATIDWQLSRTVKIILEK